MWLKQTSDWMEGVGFSLTRAVNGVGVFFLAVMMMVTAVDVIGRFVFNLPVKGSIEITGFLLVFTIFLAIAYAQSREQHITIDILVSRFPDRARLIINTIILLIGLIILAVFAWQSIEYSMLMNKANRITAVLEMPVSPFVLVVTFGCLLFCWVLLAHLLRNLNQGISNWRQAVVWLIVGAIIIVLIYALAIWARELPGRLSPLTIGLIGMAVLFLVFLLRLPIFLSLALVGFLGMCYLRGPNAGLSLMGSSPFNVASNYTFSVIPLFVLMGEFCFFSGLSKDMYDAAYKWVGARPGGLSMGTIVACGGFAAVCGDTMATAVTMGTVTLPEMKRYNYDPRLAAGCVAAGGTLGVLIPPSLAFILYAILTDQSIALLFIAGILPGILLVFLFMLSIYLRCRWNPALGPPGPKTSFKEKIVSLKGVWATLVLFALVIGGMYAGVFTPNEGGGIGAFGALVIGLIRRRLDWKKFLDSLMETAKISAVCMSILIGANVFGYFLAASKLPMELAGFVTGLAIPPLMVLISILIIYLLLGCLMPAIPMLILTVPIFYPVVMAMGYHPIWFGVIMVIMFEMAVITPPMGINVLALSAVSKDIDLGVMYKGILPFLLVLIVCLAILVAFPDVSLILPSLFSR